MSKYKLSLSNELNNKKKADLSMDKFYVERNETWDLGYQRSIVVQFSKGIVRGGGGTCSFRRAKKSNKATYASS